MSENRSYTFINNIIILFGPILVAVIVSFVLRGGPNLGNGIIQLIPVFDLSSLQTIVFYSSVTIILAMIFYFILEKKRIQLDQYLVSFILSPIIFVVLNITSQALLLIILKGTEQYLLYGIIAFATIYLTIFSTVFILFDAIPPRIKNGFVLLYGSIFGTFIGYAQPTFSLLVSLIGLVILDIVFFRLSPVAQDENLLKPTFTDSKPQINTMEKLEDRYYNDQLEGDPTSYLRLRTKDLEIGIGDILIFSAITSHAYNALPVYLLPITIGSLILGILLSMYLASKSKSHIPGIPVPVLTATLPWIVIALLQYLNLLFAI